MSFRSGNLEQPTLRILNDLLENILDSFFSSPWHEIQGKIHGLSRNDADKVSFHLCVLAAEAPEVSFDLHLFDVEKIGAVLDDPIAQVQDYSCALFCNFDRRFRNVDGLNICSSDSEPRIRCIERNFFRGPCKTVHYIL